jgi:hypothetical protein
MTSKILNGTYFAGYSIASPGVTLTNFGAVISSFYGVYANVPAKVINYGRIGGDPANLGPGIQLQAGGSITNQSDGTIDGYKGIYAGTGAATVVNTGRISGSNVGIVLAAGGAITNQSGGTISGGSDAVRFGYATNNLLVIDPGAVFSGTVDGGNAIGDGVASTLNLAADASAGTLAGLGSRYIDFAIITIDTGATWTLSGKIGAGYTITDGGTLRHTHQHWQPRLLGHARHGSRAVQRQRDRRGRESVGRLCRFGWLSH